MRNQVCCSRNGNAQDFQRFPAILNIEKSMTEQNSEADQVNAKFFKTYFPFIFLQVVLV
jgi:hypothetical protein